MKFAVFLFCALLVGCASTEDAPPAEPPVEPEVAAQSFAGTWSVDVMSMESDSVLVTTSIIATDTPDGWSTVFDHLDEPVPANSVVIADGVATVESGPYPSALRDGVIVTSLTSVVEVSGDELTGTFHSTYESGEPLEIDGRLRGSRLN